jgi:hypothetical protein
VPTDPKPAPMVLDDTITVPFATVPVDRWPAVTGHVRPALPKEVRAYYAKKVEAESAKDPGAAAVDVQADLIARHVKAWSVVDGAGKPVPVTADVVARLPEPVFAQFERIVFGYAGGTVLGN